MQKILNITQGCILQSTALMDEDIFKNTTILLAKYQHNDCIGFILNKPSGKYLNQLVEFKNLPAFPLWQGGPVSTDYLYLVHTNPQLFTEAEPIAQSFYLGGNIKEISNTFKSQFPSTKNIHCFLGYCGWDADQLEQEIQDGYWTIANQNISHFLNVY